MPHAAPPLYTCCNIYKDKESAYPPLPRKHKTSLIEDKVSKQEKHTKMPHTSHISYIQALGISIRNGLQKKAAYIKAVVTNETTQKILLFAAIIGLLILAANLDKLL